MDAWKLLELTDPNRIAATVNRCAIEDGDDTCPRTVYEVGVLRGTLAILREEARREVARAENEGAER